MTATPPGRARASDSGSPRCRLRRHVALVLGAIALLVTACGASAPAPSTSTSSTRPRPTTTVPTTTTTLPTTTTDPGLLPQTSDEPSNGAVLQTQMRALWQAIVDGSPDEARPLLFPESAYLQLKTGLLADPAADFADRLLAFYNLDLATYHGAITDQGGVATLVNVLVEPSYATFIGPGQCENKMGYWHLPGVRLVYQLGSVVHSFAVASLISWRGAWYVIHLGPNPRPQDVGTIDQPELGPGTPGPPGGC